MFYIWRICWFYYLNSLLGFKLLCQQVFWFSRSIVALSGKKKQRYSLSSEKKDVSLFPGTTVRFIHTNSKPISRSPFAIPHSPIQNREAAIPHSRFPIPHSPPILEGGSHSPMEYHRACGVSEIIAKIWNFEHLHPHFSSISCRKCC